MRNNFFKTILFGFSLLLLTNCSNIIDLPPQGQKESETFMNTPEGALGTVNGMYSLLIQSGGPAPDGAWLDSNYNFFMGSIATDDAEPRPGDNANLIALSSFVAQSGNGIANSYWVFSYWGISRANFVLDHLQEAPIDDALKNRYKGEALFIRAYYYNILLQHFGGVPLLSTSLTQDKYGKNLRTSLHETIDFTKKDFKEAIKLLPESYSATESGRATKGAAQAFLARLEMYELGVDEQATSSWKEVFDLTQSIINSNQYSLVSNYALIFDWKIKNSKESIFEIQTSEGAIQFGKGVVGTDYANYQGNRNASGKAMGGWGIHNPTQDLVNAFDPTDPRLSATIYGIGYNNGILYGEVQTYKRSDQGSNYFNRKIALPETPAMPRAVSQNIILMRYADVLLMHAEAAYNTGNEAEAKQYLNMVRQRARNSTYCKGYVLNDPEGLQVPKTTPNVPDIAATGKDLLTAIHNERRIEFALEGYHCWDLIRTGQFVDRVSKVKDLDRIGNKEGNEIRVEGIGANIKNHSINGKGGILIPVLPIPIIEVQNWNLTQNPNY